MLKLEQLFQKYSVVQQSYDGHYIAKIVTYDSKTLFQQNISIGFILEW